MPLKACRDNSWVNGATSKLAKTSISLRWGTLASGRGLTTSNTYSRAAYQHQIVYSLVNSRASPWQLVQPGRHRPCTRMSASQPSQSSPEVDVYLITGASRGLGFELVRQLLSQSNAQNGPIVIATARQPATAASLQQLKAQHQGRLHVLQMDTNDVKSIQAAADWAKINVGKVDVLVNNAGIIESRMYPWNDLDIHEAANILQTNVVSPLLVSSAMLPMLRSGRKKIIAHMSSSLGSLSSSAAGLKAVLEQQQPQQQPLAQPASSATSPEAPRPRGPAALSASYTMYKASKAALNMEMLIMARDLAQEGFTVVSLHPGFVATDMGNSISTNMAAATGTPGAPPPLTAEKSVAGLLAALQRVTPKDTGTVQSWDGSQVPW